MWYEKYLSIPFEPNKSSMTSCDCAGLVFLVIQNELNKNIERHELDDFTAKKKDELINKHLKHLKQVSKEEVCEFDLFYQMNNGAFHIGVVIDKNTVLETTLERGVSLTRMPRILCRPTTFYRVIG